LKLQSFQLADKNDSLLDFYTNIAQSCFTQLH